MPRQTFRHDHLIQRGSPRQGSLVEGSPQTCTVVVGISITVTQPSERGAHPSVQVQANELTNEGHAGCRRRLEEYEPVGIAHVAAARAVIRASVEGPPIDLFLLAPNLPDNHWLALAIDGSNGLGASVVHRSSSTSSTSSRSPQCARSIWCALWFRLVVRSRITSFSFAVFRNRLKPSRAYRQQSESSGAAATLAEMNGMPALPSPGVIAGGRPITQPLSGQRSPML